MLLWTWMYKYLFEPLLSILLGTYSEVKLLDDIAVLLLIFGGAAILFSIVAPFYISTIVHKGSNFCISSSTFYFLLFWIVTVLADMGWYLMVVLICISLMIDGVENLFKCFLVFCIPSLENVYSSPLTILKSGCLFFVVELYEFFIYSAY